MCPFEWLCSRLGVINGTVHYSTVSLVASVYLMGRKLGHAGPQSTATPWVGATALVRCRENPVEPTVRGRKARKLGLSTREPQTSHLMSCFSEVWDVLYGMKLWFPAPQGVEEFRHWRNLYESDIRWYPVRKLPKCLIPLSRMQQLSFIRHKFQLKLLTCFWLSFASTFDCHSTGTQHRSRWVYVRGEYAVLYCFLQCSSANPASHKILQGNFKAATPWCKPTRRVCT